MQVAFGRVRRKTSPAAVKYQTLLCSDVFGLYYIKNLFLTTELLTASFGSQASPKGSEDPIV